MSRKIVDILRDTRTRNISYSFEVTPYISDEVLLKLDFEPLFFSITWHAHAHTHNSLDVAPLKLAHYLRNKGKNVLLHISCTNLKQNYVDILLEWLQNQELCNIFIVLGENYDPIESDFKSSREMVNYVRQRTGDYFCIGVAGFPDRDDKMLHLKEKVESGADFILTQAFFDSKTYKKFVHNCKKLNINVPVIPGMFPFETKKELEGFVKLCDVHLSKDALEISGVSGNEIIAKLINDLCENCHENHFHLFTLNKLQRSIDLIKTVDLLKSTL